MNFLSWIKRVFSKNKMELTLKDPIIKNTEHSTKFSGGCNIYQSRLLLGKQIGAEEFIELVPLHNEMFAIELHPFGMYWHRSLQKFVIYSDDFEENTQFTEEEAIKLVFCSNLVNYHSAKD